MILEAIPVQQYVFYVFLLRDHGGTHVTKLSLTVVPI